ncbi:MAG: hypothetical protein HW401_202 [Parcubacteria group bacterium]|nr:hypothetical protein [Parcubacteria group bacterium]
MLANDKRIRFAVSVFGDRYVGMLISVLFSIKKSNPDVLTAVFCQDIQEKFIKPLKSYFSDADFIKTHFDFKSDYISKVSMNKTFLWNYALEYFLWKTILRFCGKRKRQ